MKYRLLTSSPDLESLAAIYAPSHAVCSTVQREDVNGTYGTDWIGKGLILVWALIGTEPYDEVELDSRGRIVRELARYVDDRTIKCHLRPRKQRRFGLM